MTAVCIVCSENVLFLEEIMQGRRKWIEKKQPTTVYERMDSLLNETAWQSEISLNSLGRTKWHEQKNTNEVKINVQDIQLFCTCEAFVSTLAEIHGPT